MGFAALDFKNTQDFLTSPAPLPDEDELSELLKFCEKPQSIGLNNVKESLRNVILYMMALMGLDTGYNYHHIFDESFVGLSIGGATDELRKKKKKRRQLLDEFLRLDLLMFQQFLKLFDHTYKFIQTTKQDIDHKIEILDRMIETNKDDGFFSKGDLKEAKTELENLKDLKTEIENIEADLNKTKDPMDIISIEKQVDDQLKYFAQNSKNTAQKSPFLAALKLATNKNKKMAYDVENFAAPDAMSHDTTAASPEAPAEAATQDNSAEHATSNAEANTASDLDTAPAETSSELLTDFSAETGTAGDGDTGDNGAEDASETNAETSVDASHSAAGGTSSGDGDATDGDSDSGADEQEDEDAPEPPSPHI